ncbi:MAG: S8 family serine peptidase [Planctomycetes bacterium]|nr:S8 family serine peptidase [Planctomycetota bacterium]
MSLPQLILTTLAASAAVGLLGDAPAIAHGQNREKVPGGGGPEAQFVPDELIVAFHEPPTAEQLAALRGQLPKIIAWRGLRHAPHPKNDPTGIHPLAKVRIATLAQGTMVPALADQVGALAGVRYAEPNGILQLAVEPNDPLYNEQWGPQKIEAPAAWDITTGDPSVVIAFIDTGIDFEHEEFQDGAIWVNPGEIPDNGIDDDDNGFIDDVVGWDFRDGDNGPEDSSGHGTWVAGIFGARLNNGLGIAGLANITIMPLRAFGPVELVAEAIYYATDMSAAAMNMSLGLSADLEILAEAVQYAWDNGVTVVAGAGNDGWSVPFYPAAYRTVIAVSGTDANDELADFSNFGQWIDMSAPGVDILSSFCCQPEAGAYFVANGTSASSPHVCGLVGLMYSVDPTLTPQEVRDLLCENADDLGDPGFDIYFGCGRINAARTIAAIVNTPRCPADLDADGTIGILDLLSLLAAWGTDPGGPPDFDGDGTVGIFDLLTLLAAWGACP